MNTISTHEKATQDKFDKWADSFEQNGKLFQYFQKKVIDIIDLKNKNSLLDLGCGTGWAVRYAAKLLNEDGYFYGIDISKRMIEKANELAIHTKNVRFFNTSSENLPFDDNSIDSVICSFSFHHYKYPEKALNEVARVLKPKGKIHVIDITPDDLFMKLFDTLMKIIQKEHVKQYSSKEFKEMYTMSKLEYIESKIVTLYPIKMHIAEKKP
jgi:ubiquinone/menaquinone biosynthesis C-methylase UbiE